MDSVSYAVGMDIARFYQKQEVTLNPVMLYQGFQAMHEGKDLKISEEAALEVMGAFQSQMRIREEERRFQSAQENAIRGQKFLEANREKEGVTQLPSGLQYKVLTSGTGASPRADNVVRVHYVGRLVDGTEFNNSRTAEEGVPLEVQVDEVLPGWTEALLRMKPGDLWELYIPPELAYGEQGRGNSIPPNSTLIFEVELLEIVR
jgi:FKBP-type peptidyl-prolyl cis-trans isomerase FklB